MRYRWTYADGQEEVGPNPPALGAWQRDDRCCRLVKCEALPAKKVTRWRATWSDGAVTDEHCAGDVYARAFMESVRPEPSRHLVSCVRVEVDEEATR